MTMTQNDLFCQDICQNATQSPVKFGHGHFGQIRFLKGKSSKDSIYK